MRFSYLDPLEALEDSEAFYLLFQERVPAPRGYFPRLIVPMIRQIRKPINYLRGCVLRGMGGYKKGTAPPIDMIIHPHTRRPLSECHTRESLNRLSLMHANESCGGVNLVCTLYHSTACDEMMIISLG